jgi:hypothetical protein
MINRWFKLLAAMRASRDLESGQALVELALSMSLLFLILLGAVEFARVTYAGIEVSNAARAAVQYGAMNGGATWDINGMLAAAQNDSANLGTTVTIVGTPATSFACSDGSTYDATTFCGSATVFETLSVHTQTTFVPLIHAVGLPTTFTLHGYAQEMVLQ